MEPFLSPVRGNSSVSASFPCARLSHFLDFLAVLERDILSTRILEYVFLMCSIKLLYYYFFYTEQMSVSVSLVLRGPLRRRFQGKRHRRSQGMGVWFTRGCQHYAFVVCSVAVFRESLPVSHCPPSCLLLPLDWQVSVFCIFQYHGIKTRIIQLRSSSVLKMCNFVSRPNFYFF